MIMTSHSVVNLLMYIMKTAVFMACSDGFSLGSSPSS